MRFVHLVLIKNSKNKTKVMDMCGKNQEKILRLQFQKRLNNKKVIREISDLLENFVWFNITTYEYGDPINPINQWRPKSNYIEMPTQVTVVKQHCFVCL